MIAASDVRRQTSDAQRIGIAGAGLLGRLLAWKLLRQGQRVSLFDRGSRAGECSAARVAASMLAPYSEVLSAERCVFDWGRMALSWWPQELAALKELTGEHILKGQQAATHLRQYQSPLHVDLIHTHLEPR